MADLTRAGGIRYARICRAGLSPGAGRLRPGGRRQQAAAALPQGEQQQRLRRDGRRDLSRRAAVPADGPDLRQGAGRPRDGLQHLAALEVPVRPARRRHLSAGQRPGLRRRRGLEERGRHDAGRGERQPDPALRRHRPDGRQRRFRLAMVAAADPVGGLPREVRRGSREPALHRRLHGPPGPQRQPLGQGDPGHRRLRRPLPDARRRARRARSTWPWPAKTPATG